MTRTKFFEGPITSYFAIEDRLAGKKNVYTLYGVKLVGSREAIIVGRELSIADITKLVKTTGAR